MQPNFPPPGYGPPSPGGFGPPPGSYGFYGMAPSGPSLGIVPAGSGGFALKYTALGGYLGMVIAGAVMVFVGTDTANHRGDGMLLGLSVLALVAMGLLWGFSAMAWIYKSWEFLPPEYRRNSAGRVFTPEGAVGWQFVPLYNLYWVFAQNLGYCEAVDSVMAQSGRAARSPKTAATVACVLQVVPYLNFLAAPIVWLMYMFSMDAVKSQLLAPPR
jgi:hypothetical protein